MLISREKHSSAQLNSALNVGYFDNRWSFSEVITMYAYDNTEIISHLTVLGGARQGRALQGETENATQQLASNHINKNDLDSKQVE